MLDNIDIEVLKTLQANARETSLNISKKVGRVPAIITERIRKLTDNEFIQGFYAKLNPKPLGYGILVFILIEVDIQVWDDQVGKDILKIDQVQELHQVTGMFTYLVKMRLKDPNDLKDKLNNYFRNIPAIRNFNTLFVIDTLKETFDINL